MRAGGERRGNSRDRKARREWLLCTYDPDLGPEVARCHLGLSERCHTIVDSSTLSVDRINPGGTYRRDNIRPACLPCQAKQGALITNESRWRWRALMAEAADKGISWDGVL